MTKDELPQEKKAGIEKNGSAFSLSAFASTTLAFLALIAAFLAFMGYGVALSVETEFGIPHASIFKSSFDLLTLSVWFFTWTIVTLSELFGNLFSSRSYWESIGFVMLISLISMGAISIFFEVYQRFIDGKFSLKSLNINNKKRFTKYAFISLLGSAISGVSVFLSVPFILALMITLSSFFSLLPMIGLSAGTKHIQDDVILPKQCAPILTRAERVKFVELKKKNKTVETYAQCIKITDGDKTIASGRVVFGTTDVVVLFDPNTGAVWREAIGNRTIETISQLPEPK
ncbi:hypothetical protein [Collimonas arenae]|uniref:hypothetical protein n=1 Tax=Collimonas arenae TaxID=279058 RepID=UPI0007787DD0|nr:hypothetical protein [Collimonas arenae]